MKADGFALSFNLLTLLWNKHRGNEGNRDRKTGILFNMDKVKLISVKSLRSLRSQCL